MRIVPFRQDSCSVDALAAAKVERASACRPLRDRALQQHRRLLAMPWQDSTLGARRYSRANTVRWSFAMDRQCYRSLTDMCVIRSTGVAVRTIDGAGAVVARQIMHPA